MLWSHIGVRRYSFDVREPHALERSRFCDTFPRRFCLAARFFGGRSHRFRRHFRNGNPHVYPVRDGSGYFSSILFDNVRHTITARGAPKTARTRIQGGNEHEIRREYCRALGARNGNNTVFQGLSKRIDDVAMKFREFIGEENAAVRERRLAGARRRGASADKRCIGRCVMWWAEGRGGYRAPMKRSCERS